MLININTEDIYYNNTMVLLLLFLITEQLLCMCSLHAVSSTTNFFWPYDSNWEKMSYILFGWMNCLIFLCTVSMQLNLHWRPPIRFAKCKLMFCPRWTNIQLKKIRQTVLTPKVQQNIICFCPMMMNWWWWKNITSYNQHHYNRTLSKCWLT